MIPACLIKHETVPACPINQGNYDLATGKSECRPPRVPLPAEICRILPGKHQTFTALAARSPALHRALAPARQTRHACAVIGTNNFTDPELYP
jgi:hypothetical protein